MREIIIDIGDNRPGAVAKHIILRKLQPKSKAPWIGAMRLLFAIGIVALIGIGITLQIRFPPNRVAVVEATAPIYIIGANHVKTLPEQETPLP